MLYLDIRGNGIIENDERHQDDADIISYAISRTCSEESLHCNHLCHLLKKRFLLLHEISCNPKFRYNNGYVFSAETHANSNHKSGSIYAATNKFFS